ncbi:Uncharacterised protein [Mycobacteroides abscessus subsp. abscessus]|nr:Uncharacterised protein [Mycobacteroides abscessus subsp. abscessus]
MRPNNDATRSKRLRGCRIRRSAVASASKVSPSSCGATTAVPDGVLTVTGCAARFCNCVSDGVNCVRERLPTSRPAVVAPRAECEFVTTRSTAKTSDVRSTTPVISRAPIRRRRAEAGNTLSVIQDISDAGEVGSADSIRSHSADESI